MSGVQRIFSRREKKNTSSNKNSSNTSKPDALGSLFKIENESGSKVDKEEGKKIAGVLERLRQHGIDTMVEANVRYALRTVVPAGDGDAAYRLLMLLQETFEGEVKPYNPDVHMVGAINREMVTCYLDALLFSMFALLDSFEAMLYDSFEDVHRKRLAGMLRLWVNMLRTGRLITTDVTKALQAALSNCGWEDAARTKQQDPSEAFTFITGQLELPLLTLKMDLYHTGREDPQDDHKFVNERLLEVAIVDRPAEGTNIITLEECLENYFNNRIEVKRFMESKRRNTLKLANMSDQYDGFGSSSKVEKESGVHVEVAELSSSSPSTPLVQTPLSESPITPFHSKDPLDRLRPGMGRKRADSIFSQRRVELTGTSYSSTDSRIDEASPMTPALRERKSSTRTEVLMPAWQFFKLLPWYTDHMPESDAQVAAHFSHKRPVLGICLKRYSYTSAGQAQRRDTYVDIPLEIAVPDFVSDEHMEDGGPLVGNFRLLLMSVVCHRGSSVHSGHYISLCRSILPSNRGSATERRSSSESIDAEDPWLRFDDLAKERIIRVADVQEALKKETPYLLFYQVQPIDEPLDSTSELPTYAEATCNSPPEGILTEKLTNSTRSRSRSQQRDTLRTPDYQTHTEATDFAQDSRRPSTDINSGLESPRGRSSLQVDDRRGSLATTHLSAIGSGPNSVPTSAATTPNEEKDRITTGGLLSVAANAMIARRASKRSKSRASSVGPESNQKFGMSMAKLTQKLSRSDMNTVSETRAGESAIDIRKNRSAENVDAGDRVVTPGSMEGSRPSTAVHLAGKTGRTGQHGHHGRKKDAEDRECVVM